MPVPLHPRLCSTAVPRRLGSRPAVGRPVPLAIAIAITVAMHTSDHARPRRADPGSATTRHGLVWARTYGRSPDFVNDQSHHSRHADPGIRVLPRGGAR